MRSRLVRVAAVDDHPMMLRGLTDALAGAADLEFVGAAASVADLQERLGSAPDVVLLDLRLADGSRPRDNAERLVVWGARVLVFTEGDRFGWIGDALGGGAQGVVLKHEEEDALLAAVRDVADGAPALSAEMALQLARDVRLRPNLTAREREALQLLASGLNDAQIARVMGITDHTVQDHVKKLRVKYRDLGRSAPSRVDLVRRALEDDIADPPEAPARRATP